MFTQMIEDLKAHFEHGHALHESHLPALAELAAKVEQDPLVLAALNFAGPDQMRPALAAILTSLAGEVASVTDQARAAGAEEANAAHAAAAAAAESAAPQ